MSFEIESPSLFERVIRATIPASDIETRIQKMAKKLSREVNLRGFRKGKIPTNVIVRRFWDHMQADIQADVVNSVYEEIDREQPLTILTEPELEAEPLERGKDFSFKLELMIRPRIDVAGLDSLRHKPSPTIGSDEDVDGDGKLLREQSAENTEVDQAAGPGLFAEVDATLKQGDQKLAFEVRQGGVRVVGGEKIIEAKKITVDFKTFSITAGGRGQLNLLRGGVGEAE